MAADPGHRAPQRPVRSVRDRAWTVSAGATGAVVLAAAAFLLVRTRREWFFIDEWEFLALRVGPHPAVGLLIPHNEHPSMIPILVWRALFDLFGIHRYLPYMAALVVFQAGVVGVIWIAARLSGAGPAACFLVATVMATAGVGQEDVIWAFQIGMVGSLVASWSGAALTDHVRGAHGPGRLVLTWAVLSAGLACSAVSVPLLVLPFVVAGARRGWRSALLVVSAPGALFIAWYLRWGRDGVSASKGLLPLQLAGYVVQGLTAALDGLTGVAGTAAVALVLVALAVRTGRFGTTRRAMATAGLAGTVALFVFISVGRAGLGDGQAQSSRYAYLAVALVLPAAAAGVQDLLDSPRWARPLPPADRRSRGLTWAVVVVCAVALVGRGLGLIDDAVAERVSIATQTRAVAAAGNALVASGAPLLADVGSSRYSGHLDGAALIRLHDLGELGGLRTPSRKQLAASRLVFQFHWTTPLTRAALSHATAAPTAAVVAEYRPSRRETNPVAVAVRPGPFTAAPTVLAGHRVATPASVPTAIGCVTVAPTAGAAVFELHPHPGGQAVLVLVSGTTTLHYGWAATGTPAASVGVPLTSTAVGELATVVGTGDIRLTATQSLTVCPVA